MQILPDIYEINGSEFGRWQNTFLVDHGGATVMFDCGDMSSIPAVYAKDAPAGNGLSEVELNASIWGFDFTNISHLFVTHEHFDHASHAAALQRKGIQVVASVKAAEAMAAADKRVIGWAHGRDVEPCTPDIILEDGQEVVVGDLRVRGIAIPGHSDGSMVFDTVVNGQHNWFIGDLFSTVTAHQGVMLPWMGDVNANKTLYTESLERLLDEPARPDNLFPGHGPSAIGFGYLTLQMCYRQVMTTWRSGPHQR